MPRTAPSTAPKITRAAVKSLPKDTGKPAPKAVASQPASKPRKAVVTTQPSLRFYHSKELRAKTLAVLDALESAPEHPRHGDALADLVAELIDAGMDYYFLRGLKQAQVGFVAEQSARLGLSGAVKLMASVSRKFIVRMDERQLLVVAQHIRALG